MPSNCRIYTMQLSAAISFFCENWIGNVNTHCYCSFCLFCLMYSRHPSIYEKSYKIQYSRTYWYPVSIKTFKLYAVIILYSFTLTENYIPNFVSLFNFVIYDVLRLGMHAYSLMFLWLIDSIIHKDFRHFWVESAGCCVV